MIVLDYILIVYIWRFPSKADWFGLGLGFWITQSCVTLCAGGVLLDRWITTTDGEGWSVPRVVMNLGFCLLSGVLVSVGFNGQFPLIVEGTCMGRPTP